MLPLAGEKGVACEILPALGREIRPLSDLRAFFGLVRIMRDFRPHVVHTHAAKAGCWGGSRLGWREFRWWCTRSTGTSCAAISAGRRRPSTALSRALLARRTDAVVAVSEAVRDDLARLGVAKRERIRVVPLGLELDGLSTELPKGVLRRELGIGADVPLVGFVGRLVPIKDAPTFLQAARLVHDRLPEARFVLVGDGEARSLLEMEVQALGLSGFASFAGWRRDLAAVYGDLSVVVNTSRNEGTPVSLIEALAAARPVVATRVGGTPDVLGNGAFGRLVPAADPQALAEAILETLADPGAAKALALAGQRHVLGHYSVDRLLGDMDELYRGLLAQRERAA